MLDTCESLRASYTIQLGVQKEKTTLLRVNKEKLVLNMSFPLAKANTKGEKGDGGGGRGGAGCICRVSVCCDVLPVVTRKKQMKQSNSLRCQTS